MGIAVCSLKWDEATAPTQKITHDADGYHLVRFPYTSDGESYDPWRMHEPANGGSTASKYPDARSGLIWPSHTGWGVVSALVFWAPSSTALEYRARFVRDPLKTSTGYDATATSDSTPTRGGQYRSYMWQMFVQRGTPIGLKVAARGAGDAKIVVPLTLAEFKLAIHTDVLTPA